MREPRIKDRWKDGNGDMVTVSDVAFNFVRFIRDGYRFPVTYPPERFFKEFSFVREELPE